jgi:hypothetical protein
MLYKPERNYPPPTVERNQLMSHVAPRKHFRDSPKTHNAASNLKDAALTSVLVVAFITAAITVGTALPL